MKPTGVVCFLVCLAFGEAFLNSARIQGLLEARDWGTFSGTCPEATETLYNFVNAIHPVTAGADTTAVCDAIKAVKDQERITTYKGLTVGLEIECGWMAFDFPTLDYDQAVADPKSVGNLAQLHTDGCDHHGKCFAEWKTKPILIAEVDNAQAAAAALFQKSTLQKDTLSQVITAYNNKIRAIPTYQFADNARTTDPTFKYKYVESGKAPTPQVNFAFPISRLLQPCVASTLSRSRASYNTVVHGGVKAAVTELITGSLSGVDDDFKGLLYLVLYGTYAEAQLRMRRLGLRPGAELGAGIEKSQLDPLFKSSPADALRLVGKGTKLQWWRWLKTTTVDAAAAQLAAALDTALKASAGSTPDPSVFIASTSKKWVKDVGTGLPKEETLSPAATFEGKAVDVLKTCLRTMLPNGGAAAYSSRFPGETANWYGNGIDSDQESRDITQISWDAGVAAGKPVAAQMIADGIVGIVFESRDSGSGPNSGFSVPPNDWRSSWNNILSCAGLPTVAQPDVAPVVAVCTECTMADTSINSKGWGVPMKNSRFREAQTICQGRKNSKTKIQGVEQRTLDLAKPCECDEATGKLCKE
jgi:hypothetical protein